jgi:electron transfer flavoprotein alpha/beta subunit
MRRVIGNDELGAAEIMLRARDRHPGVHLSAITLGDEHAMPILRHLKALGFERCVRLNSETDTRFAPAFVAERISRYIRQNAIDLVLLGTQSCEVRMVRQAGWSRKCLTGRV